MPLPPEMILASKGIKEPNIVSIPGSTHMFLIQGPTVPANRDRALLYVTTTSDSPEQLSLSGSPDSMFLKESTDLFTIPETPPMLSVTNSPVSRGGMKSAVRTVMSAKPTERNVISANHINKRNAVNPINPRNVVSANHMNSRNVVSATESKSDFPEEIPERSQTSRLFSSRANLNLSPPKFRRNSKVFLAASTVGDSSRYYVTPPFPAIGNATQNKKHSQLEPMPHHYMSRKTADLSDVTKEPQGYKPRRNENDSTSFSSSFSDAEILPGGVVYACFLLMGLGTLLPWNFFITAETYWQYKFRNATSDVDANNTNNTEHEHHHHKTELQSLYTPMQVCFSQFANFIFLFINALFSHKVSQKVRLVGSLTMMIILFSVTTALVKTPTDDWQSGFFALTMIIILIMNASGAILQGGLFGVAGLFPERYMTAVISGQAVGGIFASGSRIVSLAVGAGETNAAFIYFMIAVAVMGATLVAYLYMSNTEFYRHYSNCQEVAEPQKDVSASQLWAEHARIFGQIWPLGVSVCAVFWTTLAVFPAVCVKIISNSEDIIWSDVYFQPVATFLLFNVGDYLGRQGAGFIAWPLKGSKFLYLFVGLRVVFIPLFLLCNHNPESPIPTLFSDDAWYIGIMVLFALTNGYLASLCMMYGPRMVAEQDAEKAGSMMAAMLGLGLLLGGMSSFAFALIE